MPGAGFATDLVSFDHGAARGRYYHMSSDTAETLHYLRLTWLATALIAVVAELAAGEDG